MNTSKILDSASNHITQESINVAKGCFWEIACAKLIETLGVRDEKAAEYTEEYIKSQKEVFNRLESWPTIRDALIEFRAEYRGAINDD